MIQTVSCSAGMTDVVMIKVFGRWLLGVGKRLDFCDGGENEPTQN